MRKLVIGLVALGVVAGGVYYSLGSNILTGSPAQTRETLAAAPVKARNHVVAEAKVVPIKRSSLSVPAAGLVAEVLVEEGDRIEAGQVLARLDSARQATAVAQAEAGLSRSLARLREVKAGPRPQEAEVARAGIEAAQAQLAKVQQGARPEEIAAAEAAVNASLASLAKAQEGTTEDKIAAARADLAKLMDGATNEDILAAELAVEQAKASLWGTQSERDGTCGRASGYQCDAANAKVGVAERAVEAAQNTVNKLNVAPRQPDVTAAQARLDELLKGPNTNSVAAAEAQVQQAQANLDKISASARPAEIAAAQAEIRRSQAQLGLVQAGPRGETIAVAEADVAASQAVLQQALATLAETELRAPFAGTVVSLELKPGEYITPGAPVLSLADLSTWQIETADLTELGVVRVQEGNRATITFDAIPGLELAGTVSRIRALGEKKQGDILYTVAIEPDRQEEQLRWNMTASVAIEPR